ncbi:MAG: ankyrin repeat domain-containing protein, partial [Nitrosomonadales bacterium]|nr:ankyrin repeat domain-containing protein [Nitrosomonadales bacterium]
MKIIISILLYICILFSYSIKSEDIPYLLTASSKGDIESVKAIIESGGNSNTEDGNKVTALMYASRKNQVEVAKYLLSKGAKVNKQELDGWTALMY